MHARADLQAGTHYAPIVDRSVNPRSERRDRAYERKHWYCRRIQRRMISLMTCMDL